MDYENNTNVTNNIVIDATSYTSNDEDEMVCIPGKSAVPTDYSERKQSYSINVKPVPDPYTVANPQEGGKLDPDPGAQLTVISDTIVPGFTIEEDAAVIVEASVLTSSIEEEQKTQAQINGETEALKQTFQQDKLPIEFSSMMFDPQIPINEEVGSIFQVQDRHINPIKIQPKKQEIIATKETHNEIVEEDSITVLPGVISSQTDISTYNEKDTTVINKESITTEIILDNEQDIATAINEVSTTVIASAADDSDNDFLHLSTDDIEADTQEESSVKEEEFSASSFFPFDPNTEDTIHVDTPSTQVVIPIDVESIGEYISAQSNAELTKEQKVIIGAKVNDISTIENRLIRSLNFVTDSQALNLSSFTEAIERGDKLTQSVTIGTKTYRDDKVGKDQFSKLKSGTVLSAKKSLPTIVAITSGIRQVHLYNSGFWVIVRPPLLHELHLYYTACTQGEQEYGRQFGQLSFYPADVDIRQASMNLFVKCIQDSNLEGFQEEGVLERNISELDYDTCLWAMASLMYKDGTYVDYICSSNKCNNTDHAKIDLAKMRFFNWTRLGKEGLMFCHSNEKRTEEQLNKYRTEIIKSKEQIKIDDHWIVTAAVPSFYAAQQDKRNYVDQMLSDIQLTTPRDAENYVTCKYYRVFTPWIEQITYFDPETGKYLHFSDVSQIPQELDILQLNETPVPEKIINMMKTHKLSHYCYTYSQCPKCGEVPTLAVNGQIPVDMQQSFFSHAIEKYRS